MQTKKRAKPVKFGKNSKKTAHDSTVKANKLKIESIEDNSGINKLQKDDVDLSAQIKPEIGDKNTSSIQLDHSKENKINDESDQINSNEIDENGNANNLDEIDVKSDDRDDSLENDSLDMEDVEDDELGNDEFFSKPPEAYDRSKGIFKYFISIVVIAFILGLGIMIGGNYAISNRDNILSTIKQEPTEPPSEKNIDSVPSPEIIDLEEFGIRILNGTAVSGLAAELKDDLESAGFRVQSIGNADSSTYENTEVEVVDKVSEKFLDKIKERLSKSYVLGDVTSIATGDADLIITIGSASAK